MKKSVSNYIMSGLLVSRLTGVQKLIAAYLCRKAELDEQSVKLISEYSSKGRLVFASFQSSNIALIMLYNLLNKSKLELPRIALECNPFMLQSFTHILKRIWFKIRHPFTSNTDHFFNHEFVDSEFSEMRPLLFSMMDDSFFLKRYMENKYDTLYYLIELQRKSSEPIFLVPQTIFWSRKADKGDQAGSFKATADRSFLSALVSTATPSYVHMIEPVNILDVINEHGEKSSEEIAHLIRDMLIEFQQKEDRIVLGPVLAPKNEMMERVLHHRNIREAIERIHKEDNRSKKRLRKKAYRYYKEIAADFSINYIKFFGVGLNWVFRKIFSGFLIDENFIPSIKEAAKKGPVVLVPCHRSHMDYLILSYAFFQNRVIPPHIAAGVNLSFFPIGTVFRHSGAFFLRRTFKNLKLYPEIFKQYLKTLMLDRYQIEFFIEGGRTRTGRLLFPRPGLLSYLIEAADEGYAGDITFVPISINYDRVLEEGAYLREIKGSDKKSENFGAILSGRKFLKKDFGYVYVNAGETFTLADIRENTANDELVPVIGHRIVCEIAKAVTISPVAFVTLSLLLYRKRGVSNEDLLKSAQFIASYIKEMQISSAKVFTQKSVEEIVLSVLDVYVKDGIVNKIDDKETGDLLYSLSDDNRQLVAFYKNSIAHHMLPLFTLANILYRHRDVSINIQNIYESFDEIFTFLKFEYVLPVEDKDILHQQINHLLETFFVSSGMLVCSDQIYKVMSDVDTVKNLHLLSTGIEDLLESFYIAVSTLERVKKSKIESKNLAAITREHGKALLLTGEIDLVESISIPVFNNCLNLLQERAAIEKIVMGRKKRGIEIINKKVLSEIIEQLTTIMTKVKK